MHRKCIFILVQIFIIYKLEHLLRHTSFDDQLRNDEIKKSRCPWRAARVSAKARGPGHCPREPAMKLLYQQLKFFGSYKLYFLYKSTEIMRRAPPAINILSLNGENFVFGWRKKSSSSSISTISSISSSISSSTCAHLHST